MALDVTIYTADGTVGQRFEADKQTDVDFVSLVSRDTYGPPALIGPSREGTRAGVGDRVLYINTNVVPAWLIERNED